MDTFILSSTILQYILLILFGIATLYIFIFAFGGIFPHRLRKPKDDKKRKFAVLIPGYKEDQVIIDVASEALKQDYPREAFDVVIIADSFQQHTLDKLKEMPLKLIEVSFEKSTKSKALNKAMEQLPEDYDIALVLDADNVMEEDFLSKMNDSFAAGYSAVQGHRVAKNMNTSMAVLDAVSEEINNHIFRKGHRVLGLSSAIIGSGMAFEYLFFKNMMKEIKAIGGFDKEIELKMLKERHKIEYLENALVYDEKVQKEEVFSNQRRRWLSAQFHYFRKDFLTSLWHLVSRGNVDYFDKAFQFIQPPRVLLLGLLSVFAVLFLLLNYFTGSPEILSIYWLVVWGLCILSFFLSIPGKFYNGQTLKAVLSLPRGMFLMLMSMLRTKGANKKFIHTQHGTIDNNPKSK